MSINDLSTDELSGLCIPFLVQLARNGLWITEITIKRLDKEHTFCGPVGSVTLKPWKQNETK